MSKTLKISLYTSGEFVFSNKNIIALLNDSCWTIFNNMGKIEILDSKEYEWINYKNSNANFEDLPIEEAIMFHVYHKDGQIISMAPESQKLTIWIEVYPKKIKINQKEFFDYNWYYENIINEFNKNKIVIERVQFDEY